MNWKKILTIVLIVAFAGEILVLSFTNNNSKNIDAQTPSPTPTAIPVVFSGKGYGAIQILNFTGKGYFQCGGEKTDLTQIINNSKIFDSVSKLQAGFYRISTKENLSSSEFDNKKTMLQALTKNYCNSTLTYRLGQVKLLDSTINLTSADGKIQVLSVRQIENYFYYQGSRVNALLIPRFLVNDTGFAEMLVTTHDYAIDPLQGDIAIIEQVDPLSSLLAQSDQIENNQTSINKNNTNSTSMNSTTNKTIKSNSTIFNKTN